MVARLKGVIRKLVRYTQSTIIKGMNIFEGWTLASEVLDKMKNLGNDMVFKIDFEKSSDNVDWDFLWFVMSKMGFGDR